MKGHEWLPRSPEMPGRHLLSAQLVPQRPTSETGIMLQLGKRRPKPPILDYLPLTQSRDDPLASTLTELLPPPGRRRAMAVGEVALFWVQIPGLPSGPRGCGLGMGLARPLLQGRLSSHPIMSGWGGSWVPLPLSHGGALRGPGPEAR